METYRVVVFDRQERAVFDRILPIMTIVYDKPKEDGDARTIGALSLGNSADATYEILNRAQTAIRKLRDQCLIESKLEHWTNLTTTGETITPDTPGDGLFVNPYATCQYLAEARALQAQDADAALKLICEALPLAQPRPNNWRDG